MQSVLEQNIQSVIDLVKNGETQAEAAAQYGIHLSTLSRHLRGATSRRVSKITSQRLTPAQESFLVDWALNQEAASRAPSKAELIQMA